MKPGTAVAILALFLLAPETVVAATYYVRAGASGANNGVDWTNAYTSLPATLVRGSTYYIADGSYGAYTFDDANSGTILITIRKATQSEHGTDTGWSTSYGDGVANFPGITFSSSYWVFDGATRNSPKSGHGFKISAPSGNAVTISGTFSNITIRYTEMEGDPTLVQNSNGVYGIYSPSQITVQYSYIHHTFGVHFYFINGNGLMIEHSVMSDNKSTPEWHSESIQCRGCVNLTSRYNLYERIQGTAIIVSGSENSSYWYIHGNVFKDADTGHGPIADNFNGSIHHVYIYNNSFINLGNGGCNFWNGTGNIEVVNNVWYNAGLVNFAGVTVRDYNYYSAATFLAYWAPAANETPVVTCPAGKCSTITSNPFVNISAGNFRLMSALSGYPGVSSGSIDSTDPDGNIRGADGVWDRGSFEYVSGVAAQRPAAPTNLRIF